MPATRQQKCVDLLVAKSRSKYNLMTLRDLDGLIPEVQELLTAAGFQEGDKISIVLTSVVDEIE